MRWLWRTLVRGLTTALSAVSGATLLVSLMDHQLYFFGWPAALRVGAPAFLIGATFFPVDAKKLASRVGFTCRALLAAMLSCVAHRALLAAARPDFTFIPPPELDATTWLALAGTTAAGALAWLLQPAMKRLARQANTAPGWAPISAAAAGAVAPRPKARVPG